MIHFYKPFLKILSLSLFSFILGDIGAQTLNADSIPEYRWVQLMLQPKPNYYEVKRAFDAHYHNNFPKKGTGFKSFKRWEQRVINHLDDSGYVIWNAQQINDFLIAHSSPLPNSTTNPGFAPNGNVTPATYCADWGRWAPVGPSVHPYNQTSQPTGIGRINGIAFHPTDSNTFFALAPQGGVWKTKDYGNSWSHLWTAGTNNSFVTLGASSMVLSYNNPDTLYIGTGDRDAGDAPGYGVVFSSNGGATFSLRNTGMGNVTVGKMRMHPKNSAILIAATNSGVFKSTNSGLNWTRTSTNANYTDVEFHPYNPNIVYAASNGFLYKSNNAGSSFSQVTTGLPTSGVQRGEIAVTKADRGTVFFLTCVNSRFQGLYVSRDSANSFTNSSATPANILGYSELGNDNSGQGWYDLDLTADPLNKNTIYAFGVNIWKSTNAGSTFTVCGHWVGAGNADDVHADQHAGEFNNSGRTIFSGNDGGIYFSKNGGKTWNNISSGIQNSQIYRLSVAKSVPNMSAQGYQDNGSAMHQNDNFFTYWGGDGMDCAVDPTNDKYVFGSYIMGAIYRQYDRRLSKDIAANGLNSVNEGGGWLTPFVLQEGNPNRMFAGYNNVWRCDSVKSNGTINFKRISTGFPGNIQNIKNSAANKNILYVVRGDGKLYRSDNAGTATTPTWTDLSGTMPSGITLRAIEPHPKDSNVIYIAGNSILYKSTNKGSSWTQIGNLGNASPVAGFSYGTITTLKYDSTGSYEDIYIGTDRGVYIYLNSGAGTAAGITEFISGFPMWADVTDLDIYYAPKNRLKSTIFASTYGRGVWRSNLADYGAFSSPKFKTSFYAFDSVFTVGGKARLYEQVEGSVTSLKWQITPRTFSWVNNDSTGKIIEAKFNAPGIYTVTLTANSCGTSGSFTKKHWIKVFANSANPTCISTTTPSSVNYGMGIAKVSLNDNSNETGLFFDDGQNINVTKQKVFKIKPSVLQSLKVTAGLGYAEYARVYIDYNNNGKFENYKGEVLASVVANSVNDAVFNFTPPANLVKNQPILMRVMSDYYPLDTNACKTIGYGQSEDYSLVYEKVSPNLTADKKTVCTKQNIVFSDSSEGLINQWDWNFGAGAIPQTATGKGPHTVTYHSAGLKSIKLTVNGSTSDTILKKDFITVIQKPTLQVRSKSGSLEVCQGNAITLAVKDSFNLPLSNKWYKAPLIFKGTDTTLLLNNLSYSDTGNYYSIAQYKGCSDTSLNLKVGIFAKPKVAFTINASQQCVKGNDFKFTNTSTIDFNLLSTYRWSILTTPLKSNSKDYAVKIPSYGNYSVKLIVGSDKSCFDSLSKPIQVWANPKANWSFKDSAQCDKNNLFTAINSTTIGSNETIFYTWKWADATSESGVTPKPHQFSNVGSFNNLLIAKTINNCADTFAKIAIVYETYKPSFEVLNSMTQLAQNSFCENEFMKISNTSNPTDKGTYVYTLNGKPFNSKSTQLAFLNYGQKSISLVVNHLPEGCIDSSSQTIDIKSIPTAKFTLTPNPLCAVQQELLGQNGSTNPDLSPLTYTWQIEGIKSETSTNLKHIFASKGTYVVRLIANNKGCTDTLTNNTVTVIDPVSAAFNYRLSQTRNAPNQLQIELSAVDTTQPDISYQWKFGDDQLSGKYPIQKINANSTYTILLKVENAIGCMDTSTQIIKIENPFLMKQNNERNFNLFPNPTANTAAYSFSAKKGERVKVKITTVVGQQELYSRNWDIQEDGQYFETINLENLHISAGTYPIQIECGSVTIWSKIIYLR